MIGIKIVVEMKSERDVSQIDSLDCVADRGAQTDVVPGIAIGQLVFPVPQFEMDAVSRDQGVSIHVPPFRAIGNFIGVQINAIGTRVIDDMGGVAGAEHEYVNIVPGAAIQPVFTEGTGSGFESCTTEVIPDKTRAD